jgi:hypothetical protein
MTRNPLRILVTDAGGLLGSKLSAPWPNAVTPSSQ